MSSTGRVRLTVAYDGTGFSGVAPNEGVTTVGGVLGEALGTVLGVPVELTFAGRTDKGVHASGQVVSFDAPLPLDGARLVRSVNALLGGPVVVRDPEVVAADFDARFSARWRHYRYTLRTSAVPDPLDRHRTWWVGPALDLDAMRNATVPLVGEHDFSAFCRRPRTPAGVPAPSLVRRVHAAEWTEPGPGLVVFDIVAGAFCHQMVRSVVGTLVDVGRGRGDAASVAARLRRRERRGGSNVAPPQGLCLVAVGYDETP